MKIIIEINEEIVAEFEELPHFWITNESYELIKPTIQETLRKYIIDSINERRIELAATQAATDTIKVEDGDITIDGEK